MTADELNQELEAVEIGNESDLASETRNSVSVTIVIGIGISPYREYQYLV